MNLCILVMILMNSKKEKKGNKMIKKKRIKNHQIKVRMNRMKKKRRKNRINKLN